MAMRFSGRNTLNIAAWAVLVALACGAVVAVNRLGFLGLFLFGVMTLFVCTMASLDGTVATWGEGPFRAALKQPRREEDRAAAAAERQAATPAFKFYGRCGAFLALVGAAGFALQAWTGW